MNERIGWEEEEDWEEDENRIRKKRRTEVEKSIV
jgi:hypothetical protein